MPACPSCLIPIANPKPWCRWRRAVSRGRRTRCSLLSIGAMLRNSIRSKSPSCVVVGSLFCGLRAVRRRSMWWLCTWIPCLAHGRGRRACARFGATWAGTAVSPFLLGGDWNCAHLDDSTLRQSEEEVWCSRGENDAFDSTSQDLGELFHSLMTFARGAGGPRAAQSRIDRCYISELDSCDWLVAATIRGSLQERSPPSDRVPVLITFSWKARARPGCPACHAICSSAKSFWCV